MEFLTGVSGAVGKAVIGTVTTSTGLGPLSVTYGGAFGAAIWVPIAVLTVGCVLALGVLIALQGRRSVLREQSPQQQAAAAAAPELVASVSTDPAAGMRTLGYGRWGGLRPQRQISVTRRAVRG